MRGTFIALTALSALVAAAQTPVVRARLDPAAGILVGQPVHLTVSVFVPNYFTGSPEFPEFEIDNAIVVLPQDRPQNSNEQIGGVTYAGITETYTIYPQQPGEFRLPPAQITVPYASAPPKSTEAHVPLPALAFHADLPAGAKDLDYFLPTTSLTIQQKWSLPLRNLRVGDSIERTVTVTATKMQAMLIPPLPLEAPDGIRVYPEEPTVQDQKTDRGEFVFGRRVQSAKYFIQKEGDYTLPAVELKWWSLSANRLVTATLPAVHLTAAANPNFAVELQPEPEPTAVAQPRRVSLWSRYKFWILVIAPICAACLVLFPIGWRYIPRSYRQLRARQRRREHSEPAYFRNLELACKRNHATRAYESLLRWLRVAHADLTVDDFLARVADPTLSSETNALGAVIFAKHAQESQWNGKRMADCLKEVRKASNTCTTKRQYLRKLNL